MHGRSAVGLLVNGFEQLTQADRDDVENMAAPRLGLVWRPTGQLTVRAAWQHWMRPLSSGTLAPVQTAGIAVEDRLLEAGGQHKRGVLQVGWTPDERTFVAGYTNGYIYYAPTARQLRNVGGAQEDSDCLLAPEWQKLYEDKVAQILKKL